MIQSQLSDHACVTPLTISLIYCPALISGVQPFAHHYKVMASLTSVKLQDTALPFLSTWGRRITSFPPWNNTKDGSCLESGDADTLYLHNGGRE